MLRILGEQKMKSSKIQRRFRKTLGFGPMVSGSDMLLAEVFFRLRVHDIYLRHLPFTPVLASTNTIGIVIDL